MPVGEAETAYRQIQPGDARVLHRLMTELSEHEDLRGFLTVTPARLAETLTGAKPLLSGFLAESAGEAVGFVTFATSLHIWTGEMRFALDDLYVDEVMRGRGVGEALMRLVFAEARKRSAIVSWSVRPENKRAIAFYQRIGASYQVSGICRWQGEP